MNTWVLRVLTLMALLAAVAWLAREPHWEPAITALGLTGTLIGLELHARRIREVVSVQSSEPESYSAALRNMKSGQVERLEMISAGLSSRYQFIADALRARVQVRVLVQGPEIAVDSTDAQRLTGIVELIERTCSDQAPRLLEIRAARRVASLRCFILSLTDKRSRVFLSWYTYDAAGNLLGHTSPVIVGASSEPDATPLIEFARAQFKAAWEEAEGQVLYP